MDMKAFLVHLDNFIIDSHIQTDSLSLEEGVRFFYPVPSHTDKSVFLGSSSEWACLCADQEFREGCTYLVCTNKDSHTPVVPNFSLKINVIFISLTISEALQLINFAFLGARNAAPNDGRLALIEFFKTISIKGMINPSNMTAWLNRFPYPLKTFIATIVVRSLDPQTDNTFVSNVTEALTEFLPNTNLFYYCNEWIIFYSQEELASNCINMDYQNFSNLLTHFHLCAGVSYVGLIPENIYTLYLTASASIDLGLKINLPSDYKNIFFFYQYNALYLIHLCSKQYEHLHHKASLYYLAHPDIVRIYLYDKDHGSDLLDVLYAFLINESSLSKTAQCLYMHRNTVYNKLSKIKNIIGYRLDQVTDNSIFILSYMVIRYYQDYLGNDIS